MRCQEQEANLHIHYQSYTSIFLQILRNSNLHKEKGKIPALCYLVPSSSTFLILHCNVILTYVRHSSHKK